MQAPKIASQTSQRLAGGPTAGKEGTEMNTRAVRVFAVAAGLTIFLGGCQTLDPYTQEPQTSNATRGAVIGAIAGAVVGLASGDDAV